MFRTFFEILAIYEQNSDNVHHLYCGTHRGADEKTDLTENLSPFHKTDGRIIHQNLSLAGYDDEQITGRVSFFSLWWSLLETFSFSTKEPVFLISDSLSVWKIGNFVSNFVAKPMSLSRLTGADGADFFIFAVLYSD